MSSDSNILRTFRFYRYPNSTQYMKKQCNPISGFYTLWLKEELGHTFDFKNCEWPNSLGTLSDVCFLSLPKNIDITLEFKIFMDFQPTVLNSDTTAEFLSIALTVLRKKCLLQKLVLSFGKQVSLTQYTRQVSVLCP